MIAGALFLAAATAAAATAAAAPATAASSTQLYRLDVAGNQTLWALDRPAASGAMIVFHRYPDGVLLSVKRADVQHIVASKYQPPGAKALKPGTVVELGVTGGGAGAAKASGPAGRTNTGVRRAAVAGQPAPGERPDGTAVLDPNRPYMPDWDSKLVPGSSLPYPASPNDYMEGKTFAYPPASATQAQPGDLPRSPNETGDPPKGPQ